MSSGDAAHFVITSSPAWSSKEGSIVKFALLIWVVYRQSSTIKHDGFGCIPAVGGIQFFDFWDGVCLDEIH